MFRNKWSFNCSSNIRNIKKEYLSSKKKAKKKYSPFQYEGPIPNKYIILDDLICSGRTVRHINKTIRDDTPSAECVGVYVFFKDKCTYRNNASLCKRDLGVEYL